MNGEARVFGPGLSYFLEVVDARERFGAAQSGSEPVGPRFGVQALHECGALVVTNAGIGLVDGHRRAPLAAMRRKTPLR